MHHIEKSIWKGFSYLMSRCNEILPWTRLTFKTHVEHLWSRLKVKLPAEKPLYNLQFCLYLITLILYTHTHTHTHIYIYIYLYIYMLFLPPWNLLTGDAFLTHDCILYEKLGWPSLTNRREQHCMLFIYKALRKFITSALCSHLNTSGHFNISCTSRSY